MATFGLSHHGQRQALRRKRGIMSVMRARGKGHLPVKRCGESHWIYSGIHFSRCLIITEEEDSNLGLYGMLKVL